jgi:predicted transcriptional regulator
VNTKWADKQVEYIEKEEDYLRNHKTIIPDALCKLEELRECKEKVISWDEMCS